MCTLGPRLEEHPDSQLISLSGGLGHAMGTCQASQPLHQLGITHPILPAASSTEPVPGTLIQGNVTVTAVAIVHHIVVTFMGHGNSPWSSGHSLHGALGCWV